MLFEFLRLLPSRGDFLIELNHSQLCFVRETEFLDEFSLLAGTMYWTLRSILSTSLKTVGHTRLSLCRMSVAFGRVNIYSSSISLRFCMEQRFFKDDWFFLQMLNDKFASLLRLACVQGKQLVCYSLISSLGIKTLTADVILCKCVRWLMAMIFILIFGYFLWRELIPPKYSWLENICEICGIKL